MPQGKVRPALQRIIDEIEQARQEAEDSGLYDVYDAFYQRLFAEPLPFNGRFIERPYGHPDFQPIANPVREATADFITFHPAGGGDTLRLGCYPAGGASPFRDRREKYLVFDLPYDEVQIHRGPTNGGAPGHLVDIYASPYRFTLCLGGFFADELYEHLLRREVRSAYEYGGIFEPFCLSDRWSELPEPMFWQVLVDPINEEQVEEMFKQWRRLGQMPAH